jgi:hypothetical protein
MLWKLSHIVTFISDPIHQIIFPHWLFPYSQHEFYVFRLSAES